MPLSPSSPPPEPKPKKRSKGAVAKAALSASYEAVIGTSNPKRDGEALIFTLPLTPFSANSQVHWRVQAALRDQYKRYFDSLFCRGSLPPRPDEPIPFATIEATFYTKRHNDVDNLIGRAKGAIDCLVRWHYLLDDGPKCLKWGAIPEQHVDGKGAAYLVLRVTPTASDSAALARCQKEKS